MLSKNVQSFIQQHKLFEQHDRLLIAISGGIDSVVLLYLLIELGYKPSLVHCNFQLRGEASDLDQALVKKLAQEHRLDFFCERFDTSKTAKDKGISIQMMAREQRYLFFEQIRQQYQYDYILTAHHLDDRIETFLLNFLRGTGVAGLRSIPTTNEYIRRPLLGVNRQEILDYQQKHKIAFREDQSNASDKYKRNFLRHQVLPKLYELAPQLANTAQQNFDHFEQMYLLYQEQIEQWKSQLLTPDSSGFTLNLRPIRSHPAGETLLWEILKPYKLQREELRQILSAKTGTLLENNEFRLLVNQHTLIAEATTPLPSKSIIWDENLDEIQLSSEFSLLKTIIDRPAKLKTTTDKIYLNPEQLSYPLQVRHWQKGDYFHPFGMNGHRQKLSDFFTNNKINRLEREKIWLLVNGNGHIIWIVGHRMDERFRIKELAKNKLLVLIKMIKVLPLRITK